MKIGYNSLDLRSKYLHPIKVGLSVNNMLLTNLSKPSNDIDYYIQHSTYDFILKPTNKKKLLMRKSAQETIPKEKLIIVESPFFPRIKDSFRMVLGGLMMDESLFNPEPNYAKLSEIRNYYKPVIHTSEYIGFFLQLPLDKALQELGAERAKNYFEIIKETAIKEYEMHKIPIVLKHHPKFSLAKHRIFYENINNLSKEYSYISVIKQNTPMVNFLQKCKFTISFTSNASVESYILGVPTKVLSPASWAYPLSLDFDENNKEKWLAILANNSFSPDEVKRGSFFNDLINDKVYYNNYVL